MKFLAPLSKHRQPILQILHDLRQTIDADADADADHHSYKISAADIKKT